MTFKLLPKEFRIEVSPLTCTPSIAAQNRHEIAYITQTPLVYANDGYWPAGDSSTADIIDNFSNNPRTSIEEEIDLKGATEWLRQQYNELCKSLAFCPTPVKLFASAWPFCDPNTDKNQGFAVFKRFRENIPINKVAGKIINAVIYTEWNVVQKENSNLVSFKFYLLKPNVVVLDFRK